MLLVPACMPEAAAAGQLQPDAALHLRSLLQLNLSCCCSNACLRIAACFPSPLKQAGGLLCTVWLTDGVSGHMWQVATAGATP
jgi:hypothetical protein